MRILIPFLSVFFLIGCSAISSPTFWPSGYAYNNNSYKAQPGPQANNLGYEYSAEKNAEIMAKWESVADELVGELEAQSGIVPNDVFIANRARGAFNASFDHALRRAFIKRGYSVSDTPDALYGLQYKARAQGEDSASLNKASYNGDMEKSSMSQQQDTAEEQEFMLMLSLRKDGMLLGQGSGVYMLPRYGYEAGAGTEILSFATPVMDRPLVPEGR